MDNKKRKVLTDEELQEVSGGYDPFEGISEIGSYVGGNSDSNATSKSGSNATSKSCGIGAGKTSCISFSKESCEKKPNCYWSSDGTCRSF